MGQAYRSRYKPSFPAADWSGVSDDAKALIGAGEGPRDHRRARLGAAGVTRTHARRSAGSYEHFIYGRKPCVELLNNATVLTRAYVIGETQAEGSR